MKEGPDIARIAALIGDPARANILSALMSGRALTASELAQEAGVTAQTTSSHLARLEEGGLIAPEKQGRHRYFRLTDPDVADALEALMGLAARTGCLRTRTGPGDESLRRARICYDHLAGERGVAMFDAFMRKGLLRQRDENLVLSMHGRRFIEGMGIDVGALEAARRPLCKTCLDWSARRFHLAGGLGASLLARFYELEWISREHGRVLRFSQKGEQGFAVLLAGETAPQRGVRFST